MEVLSVVAQQLLTLQNALKARHTVDLRVAYMQISLFHSDLPATAANPETYLVAGGSTQAKL